MKGIGASSSSSSISQQHDERGYRSSGIDLFILSLLIPESSSLKAPVSYIFPAEPPNISAGPKPAKSSVPKLLSDFAF
jgi:hypothetical protein